MSWIAMRMLPRVREWWIAGTLAGVVYGVLLMQASMELPAGTPLTGQIAYQPAWKTAMAIMLARAARFHRPLRERRWLVVALVFSAIGDFLLALPGLKISFLGGLGRLPAGAPGLPAPVRADGAAISARSGCWAAGS